MSNQLNSDVASATNQNDTLNATPLITVSDSNGQLQLTIRDGVSGWEALGALEVAALLIRNSYTNLGIRSGNDQA